MRNGILRRGVWVGTLVLAAAAWGQGAASQPADAKASADMKAVMHTMADAVKARDGAKVRECLYIDEAHKVAAAQVLAPMEASFRLQKVTEAKFGAVGVEAIQGSGDPAFIMTARTKAVDSAKIVIEGEAAVMSLQEPVPGPSGSGEKVEKQIPFVYKDGDQGAGGWKIDAAKMMHLDDERVQKFLPLLAKIGKVMDEVAGEIDSGKLATVPQAKQALTQRTIAILQESRAATQPATRPATAPAAETRP